MHAQDISIALLTQTLERVDEEGAIIPFEERRRADQLLEGERVGCPSEGILRRAQHLAPLIKSATPLLWGIALQSQILGVYTRWVMIGIATLCGIGIHSLGSAGLFHVLSPALLGLLIWNILSISLMITLGRKGTASLETTGALKRHHLNKTLSDPQVDPSAGAARRHTTNPILYSLWRLVMWLKNLWVTRLLQHQPHYDIQLRTFRAYASTAAELFAPLVIIELKRALHLSAAALVIGVLASAYWDGLIQSYHATASSTFLSSNAIESVVWFILSPSRMLLGDLPLFTPTMTPVIIAGKTVSAPILGPAAPWVHHYAISVSCWIIAPRLVLALRESLKLWRLRAMLPARLGWLESVPTLNVALAAHTNIGKTSIARTLLRRDVGEVRDAEHVTQSRSSYFLINTPQIRVRLWDTPGFGQDQALLQFAQDAHQQLKRAERRDEARGHKSSNIRQAFTDQLKAQKKNRKSPKSMERNRRVESISRLDIEALSTLEEEADIILYVVPAFPNPEQLKQTRAEWSVLALLNRPIIVMINRVYERHIRHKAIIPSAQRSNSTDGVVSDDPQSLSDQSVTLWSDEIKRYAHQPPAYIVSVLDAFQRTHRDERRLYEHMTQLLTDERRILADRAMTAWDAQQSEVHVALAQCIVRSLERLSMLKFSLESKKRAELSAAEERLQKEAAELLHQAQEQLLDLIGLQGQLRVESQRFALSVLMDTSSLQEARKRGALWGGIVSGMASGLAADLMAGGLSLGGGMLLGGVLGALGGAGAAQGYEYFNQRDQSLQLSEESLETALSDLLLFTIGASAHGRARGLFTQESWSALSVSGLEEDMNDVSHLNPSIVTHKERSADDSIEEAKRSYQLQEALFYRCQEVTRDLNTRFSSPLKEKARGLRRATRDQNDDARRAFSELLVEVIKRGVLML